MQKKLWALAVAVSALAVTAGCSTQTQTAEESEVVADNGRGCLIILGDSTALSNGLTNDEIMSNSQS